MRRTKKALVLVHPEPQSDIERDLVRAGVLAIEDTENAALFKRIGAYLARHAKHAEYEYIAYLPSEEIGLLDPWTSPLIPAAIKRHEMDLIDAHSMDDQVKLLEQVLRAKKITTVHVAGLARECCVMDTADYLSGNEHGLDGMPLLSKPFEVFILGKLTDRPDL